MSSKNVIDDGENCKTGGLHMNPHSHMLKHSDGIKRMSDFTVNAITKQ